MGYQIQFDREKCMGCYACHVSCISRQSENPEGKCFRAVKKIVEEEIGYQKNVCPGCTQCGICAKACPNGAVYRDQMTGFFLTEALKCNGCGACSAACPEQVIRFGADGKMQKCDGCKSRIQGGRRPLCIENCPVGAITIREV